MKALIISALLFFTVRAMSATVGQDLKGDCIYSPQSGREVKVVEKPSLEVEIVKPSQTIQK